MRCAQLLTSMLRTSSLTDSSTSATQSVVKYSEADAIGKSVKKLSKKLENCQRAQKASKV